MGRLGTEGFLILVVLLFVFSASGFAVIEGCAGNVWGENCRVYAEEGGRCVIKTVDNCCGNDACEPAASDFEEEGFGNCPADCLPENIEFDLIEPDLNSFLLRGDSVLFKVKISADGRKIQAADVMITGFFGKAVLYNDGKHEDGNSFDGIYANRFDVKENTPEGLKAVRLFSEFRGITKEEFFVLNVHPVIDVEIDTGDKYFLGDVIEVNGIVGVEERTFSAPIKVSLKRGTQVLFEKETESSAIGAFSVDFHTSLLEPTGTWTIVVEGGNEKNNTIFGQKEIKLAKPGEVEFLKVNLVSSVQNEYVRGSNMAIVVEIKDDSESLVEGANARIMSPVNEPFEMSPLDPGQYGGFYTVPYDLPLGKQKIRVVASKSGEGGVVSGNIEIEFIVKAATIDIEILEPLSWRKHFAIGEDLAPKTFLSYSDDEWVLNAGVNVLIHHKESKTRDVEFELEASESGFFSDSYLLTEEDRGLLKVSFTATDDFGNQGYEETIVEVSGFSLGYIVKQNSVLIAAVFIAIVAGILIGRKVLHLRKTKSSLTKRRAQLIAAEKELQTSYFEKGAIPKEGYEKQAKKVREELDGVESKLKEMEKHDESKK